MVNNWKDTEIEMDSVELSASLQGDLERIWSTGEIIVNRTSCTSLRKEPYNQITANWESVVNLPEKRTSGSFLWRAV